MSLNIEMQNQGNFLFKRRSYIPIFLLIITLTIYIFTDKFNIEESNNFILKIIKYLVWLLA